MRNLKKILALVLALVMSFSLLATANAFNDSADIDGTYEEAVEVLAALKVFQGYDNGATFQPKGDITRAEVAAIIYRIVTGDVNDAQVKIYSDYKKFDDVNSGSWYAGYVNFCANAEIVKGRTATTFDPNGKVTGYEALAMILRAIGYDKNDEFTGSAWQVQTAAVGKKLGVTDNVTAGTLGTYASREVVAELLFQTLLVPQVEYTVAFGYQSYGQDTLGYETFKLVGAVDGQDSWGRPSKDWKLDKDADKVAETSDTTLVSLAYDPAASYTVKVDECDIANDLGITRSATIEAAYIDGDSVAVTSADVTTNRYGTINPLATTSYVGAQGRLTEVYDMGSAGYRIVEINTYLAQVDKVTASYTDRNGHVTTATVDLTVYNGVDHNDANTWKFYSVPATGFVAGDYVLVTVSNVDGYSATARLNKAVVESIEIAPSVTGGAMAGWTNAVATTPSTTVIGSTTYNDADKFALNYRDGGNWLVLTDTYGNVIGLAAVATNYLVVERIEWKHNPSTVGGGYALADVVLADGTRTQGVTIAAINTHTATNTGDTNGNAANGYVSDSYVNNSAYYSHIFTYSVNDNGSYNIASHATGVANPNPSDVPANGTITNGVATISSSTNTYVATSTTVFLLADNPGRVGTTYTTYVGKDNVPSVTGATMCILTDSNGYATLVVVSNYQLATNTFVAYVTDSNVDVSNYLGNGYFVYKVGETTPTTVYDASAAVLGTNAPTGAIAWSTTAHGTGLYTFIVNANDQITSMQPYVCDLHCDESYSTGTYDRSVVKAAVKDGSFQTQGYDNLAMNAAGTGYTVTTTAAVKDFNVTNDTVVINVTKNNINSDAVLSVGALSDITAGSVVLVKYNTVGSKYTATVVYVINIGSTGVNPGADAWAIFPVGTSYVEYNNTTLQVYVNDPYLTVADLANAFGTASGGYYVTSGGITTYMAVSATSTNTVLSVMAQNQATITVTNAFGVTYTVVTSK